MLEPRKEKWNQEGPQKVEFKNRRGQGASPSPDSEVLS